MTVDYAKWLSPQSADAWTDTEAACLLYGIAPDEFVIMDFVLMARPNADDYAKLDGINKTITLLNREADAGLLHSGKDFQGKHLYKRIDFVNWAIKKSLSVPCELISFVDTTSPQTETVGDAGADNQVEGDNEAKKPWLIPNPDDPKPMHSWYVPARYFARQLVEEDSTLLGKRERLAGKVVQKLTKVGVYKRGGKLPFEPTTIMKAFSNVVLG